MRPWLLRMGHPQCVRRHMQRRAKPKQVLSGTHAGRKRRIVRITGARTSVRGPACCGWQVPEPRRPGMGSLAVASQGSDLQPEADVQAEEQEGDCFLMLKRVSAACDIGALEAMLQLHGR